MNVERILKEIGNESSRIEAGISHMELMLTENLNNYRARKSETKEVIRIRNKIAEMKKEYKILIDMLEAGKAADRISRAYEEDNSGQE